MLQAEPYTAGSAGAPVLPSLVRRVPYPLWAVFISGFFFALVFTAHFWKGVPIRYLTSDPTAIGNVASYAGFLSNAGVMFWSATAAICLFSASLLPGRVFKLNMRSFLLTSGSLTLFLALDDVYRFHETIFPRQLGIHEMVLHVTYASLALLFVISFRARVFSAEGRLLFLALFSLGMSQLLDLLGIRDRFMLEDLFKFFGIVCWFLYFLRTSWLELQRPAAARVPTAG
jgi:hypothetical protein